MELLTACSKYIAFSLPENEIMGKKESELLILLIRTILHEYKLPEWREITIDVFVGRHNSLYLAHPGPEIKISISPLLMTILGEYFTE